MEFYTIGKQHGKCIKQRFKSRQSKGSLPCWLASANCTWWMNLRYFLEYRGDGQDDVIMQNE